MCLFQSSLLCLQGPGDKKNMMHNTEVPKTMAVGPYFSPLRQRGPGDTAVSRTDDRTRNLTETTSITSERRATSCCGVDVSQHPALQTWLPPGYDYHVCSVEERPTDMDHSALCATVRLTLKTQEDIKEWFLKTRCTPVTWRVRVTKPKKGQKVLYTMLYKCQHYVQGRPDRPGTANAKRTSKNTDCPATLSVTLKRAGGGDGNVSRSKDSHLPQYPTVIVLKNTHNHNVYEADALKHRDVGPKAIQTLTRLFETGLSPKSALAALQKDLKAEYGDKYIYASADRAICPDLRYCCSLRS